MQQMTGAGEIHVWQVPLQAQGAPQEAPSLDADERRRALAFRYAEHRQRFVTAHLALRAVMASYVGAAPAELPIRTEAGGKPYIQGSAWQFNLSHSEDLALLAVAHSMPLGVDVEHQRVLKGGASPKRGAATPTAAEENLALAARHYTPAEVAWLRALPHAERNCAFFRCWTRKEAYVKAIGIGIGTDLRRIEVGFAGIVRVGTAQVRSLELDPALAARGFQAALASLSEPAEVKLLHYPGDLPRDGRPIRG